MNDTEALWAAVDKNPTDWLTWLVLADLLEEQQDERHAGVRWMALNKKRPDFHDETKTWDWWNETENKTVQLFYARHQHFLIEDEIWSLLSDWGKCDEGCSHVHYKEYKTREEALEALWRAVNKLQEQVR